jgi:hypothetical protein
VLDAHSEVAAVGAMMCVIGLLCWKNLPRTN